MANIYFGRVDGITEGNMFPDRKALRAAGIHRPLIAGIDGNASEGASSIVLNGGYVDDLDLGEEIIYTGHGGKDPNSTQQIADQSWDDPGNRGLLISELKGLPVRVTRGYNNKSKFSPLQGYKYGGLYSVTDHFEQVGKHGFKICRFRLIKIEGIEAISSLVPNNESPSRVTTTIQRIVRDTTLSVSIKELYNYSCQVCGTRIEVNGIPYAEGAHVRPLGRPHYGIDSVDNLICLCPNHHVMFDKGGFSISNDFTLIGIDGSLNLDIAHTINQRHLEYHRQCILIDHKKKFIFQKSI